MSLKGIVKKSIASVMAIHMIFGNVAIAGIGLGKVIAEDVTAPEVVIQSGVQKYIPYETEPAKGVVLQEKLNISQLSNQDTHKEVSKVEIELQVPSIKEILPSRVSIIEATTLATNGKEKGEISQSYNAETGLLTIAYKNTEAYNQYKENEKDEFEIIYIYPSEANVAEEVETIRTVKTRIEYKTENGTISSEKTEQIKAVLSQKNGEITSYETISASEIYKGYMYANQNNKAKHVTTYKTTGEISILNSEIVDGTEIKLEASKYGYTENEEENEIETNTIEYKTSKIEEEEFKKLYGEQGYIDIYLGEEKYATIRCIEIDEKGNREYATEYHTENEPEKIEAGKVEYPEGTTEVIIKTGKPQTEGTLKIENEKQIKAVKEYGIKVEEIEKITESNKIISTKKYEIEEEIKDENGQTVVDEEGNVQKQKIEKTIKVTEKATKGTIETKEPKAQMKMEMSSKSLSTLATNKTTITITLNDTNSSCTLYEAGEIKIDLPKNITNAKILSAKALYQNGIKITNATIKQGQIILTVEGKQTSYDTENISGGVNIVIDLEIDIEDTVPSHKETLEVKYGKAKANTNVNILSKYGVLMLSKWNGYDAANNTKMSIDSNERNVDISYYGEKRIATNTLNIINNYEEKINNVQIIGRINSTFESKLEETIKLSGIQAKVYYSENVNAKIEDNTWTEQFNSKAKAYKIVVLNNEINTKEKIQIQTKIAIPENVGYNQEAHIKTELNYIHNGIQAKDSANFCMKTEVNESIKQLQEEKPVVQDPKLKVNLETNKDYINNVEFDVGEELSFLINLENITQETLKDVKVVYTIPNDLKYIKGGVAIYDPYKGYICGENVELKEDNFEYNIDKLEAKEKKTVMICVKVKQLNESYQKDISSIAKVYLNDQIYVTDIRTIKTVQSGYTISLTSSAKKTDILKPGDKVTYTAIIKNIGKVSKAIRIESDIPKQIQIEKVEKGVIGANRTKVLQNSNDVNVLHLIGLGETGFIQITGIVKEEVVKKKTITEISNKATIKLGEENIESNTIAFKVKQEPDVKKYSKEDKKNLELLRNNLVVVEENEKEQQKIENKKQQLQQNSQKIEKQEVVQQQKEEPKFNISGNVWLDNNKNGKKDEQEEMQNGITVKLINSLTGKMVKDEKGNTITSTTNVEGLYTFNNVKKGKYLIIFEIDTNKYTTTTYKAKGIEPILNSDAILKSITIDGKNKQVGITDNITVNGSDISNINLGLIKKEVFDLSINKTIKSVTLITPEEVKTKEYNNKNSVKLNLSTKQADNAEVIVKYKFLIKNEGETTGYVDKLVNKLPSGMEFSSELNKDWYKGTDGNLYTTSLTESEIKPGETKEIELVLAKPTTQRNSGTFTNNAELLQISNINAIEENEQAKENNNSSTDLTISTKTSSPILYIGITLISLGIICAGAYIIKKQILDKEI